MLDELSVRDFGIIEGIAWKPAAGLNVITGEIRVLLTVAERDTLLG